MKWEDLTTVEFDALDRTIPVFLNIAAIEQHGPHLPVATDALIGNHFLDRLDTVLGQQVLVLPQVKVCCSRHHLDFAGTLSVSHMTFLAYVTEVLNSVVHAGFKRIVVVNSHGGNQAIGQVLVEQFGSDNPGVTIAMATWWTLARTALAEISESGPFGVGHACEFETSLIQLIAPEKVRGPIPDGKHYVHTYEWAEGDMLRGAGGSVYRSMKDISGGSGIVGEPSYASPEKGQRISDAVVEQLIAVAKTLAPGTGPRP
ncbi:creatinine amidohydrolase [Devosia epidermidihirudinis]|uniref:Creatinine amidohydrolase n=1 Tax=Devosia epidermidihirudinis TaxID=1293439 RepID=A0A0F5QAN1_9HYPH|nr:creatininase family protein [Devosia epidermidihirudinis]KKC37788.1 creatinine amidohydrolase [Devosia epidermidihirudinis]